MGFISIIAATAMQQMVSGPLRISKEEIKQVIAKEALVRNIDPDLAVAIAIQESQLNPNAIGPKKEVGVFQLRPQFHKVDPKVMVSNIQVALDYLVEIRRQCGVYPDHSYINCYNTGPHYKKLKHPKLFPYYKKVMQKKNDIHVSRYLVAGGA